MNHVGHSRDWIITTMITRMMTTMRMNNEDEQQKLKVFQIGLMIV